MVNKNQQAFNSMVLHLYNQGEKCIESKGRCLLRLGDKRCVVGALISDDLYSKLTGYEKNQNIVGMLNSSHHASAYFADVDRNMLLDMQTLHDKRLVTNGKKFILHEMEAKLRKTAADYGLNTSVFSSHFDTDENTNMMNFGQKPPHIGWWHTHKHGLFFVNDVKAWRWWDGSGWSMSALPHCDAEWAAKIAAIPDRDKERIAFSYYWPEGARVPRLNPEVPQWTI